MPPVSSCTEDDVLLTADDVIDRLMEYPDLRQAASSCVLRAVRVGAEWRFHKRDLEEWIDRQLAGQAPRH